jgi:hypothetical protein
VYRFLVSAAGRKVKAHAVLPTGPLAVYQIEIAWYRGCRAVSHHLNDRLDRLSGFDFMGNPRRHLASCAI